MLADPTLIVIFVILAAGVVWFDRRYMRPPRRIKTNSLIRAVGEMDEIKSRYPSTYFSRHDWREAYDRAQRIAYGIEDEVP